MNIRPVTAPRTHVASATRPESSPSTEPKDTVERGESLGDKLMNKLGKWARPAAAVGAGAAVGGVTAAVVAGAGLAVGALAVLPALALGGAVGVAAGVIVLPEETGYMAGLGKAIIGTGTGILGAAAGVGGAAVTSALLAGGVGALALGVGGAVAAGAGAFWLLDKLSDKLRY